MDLLKIFMLILLYPLCFLFEKKRLKRGDKVMIKATIDCDHMDWTHYWVNIPGQKIPLLIDQKFIKKYV